MSSRSRIFSELGKELSVAIRTFVGAMAALIFIQAFLYEPFWIPSGSMYPTLEVGDYLFVSKFSYGYSRFSFPYVARFAEPFGESGRIFMRREQPIGRGDIIVFKLEDRDGTKTTFIKRAVGLPGDLIEVRSGILHINEESVQRHLIRHGVPREESGFNLPISEYTELLPGGALHLIWEVNDRDSSGPFRVPEGHYFVMGDNRDNSQDSRVLGVVGFVPLERVIGRAEVIFFSHSGGVHIWEFWKWPSVLRVDRIFMLTR